MIAPDLRLVGGVGRAPLSVTIVARDEEEDLPACLASVAWADEVLVCDSGSTDGTVELGRRAGAHVFVDPWLGFAAHKNLCVERTRHRWVLSLDADERVTGELRRAIEGVLERDGPCDAYAIPRKSYFCGRWIRHGGWYPGWVVRLFRKDRARFGDRLVHEAVEVQGVVGRLEAPLEHYTYRSVAEFTERMRRYADLAAEELDRRGVRFRPTQLVWRPAATFLRMYVLRRGFLDGRAGLVLAGLYAAYAFVKYARLWERQEAATGGRNP